jgi:tetratricopeptide (TPR) repeat protein
VRRNRIVAGLACLAFVATLAGLAGTLLQLRRARVARDFAVRRLARAERISELTDVLLDEVQAPEKLLLERKASPADQAEVLISLAVAANASKDGGARSRRLLEEAYTLSRGVSDPSTRARAACARAEAEESEALFKEGLGELPERPEFALDRASCLRIGGAVSRARGQGSEAISRLQSAQQALKEAPIPSWRLELLTSMDLAMALRIAGRYREAGTQFERLAARLTSEEQNDTDPAAQVYYGWGLALISLGRPLEAEKHIHRAMVIDGGAIPWQLNSQAEVLRDLGRLDEAAAQAERGYDGALKSGDGAQIDQALFLRASIYRLRGDLSRAQGMLTEVEPRGSGLAPGNIFFASLLSEKAQLAQARGDAGTALDLINQALPIAEASVKAGQPGADLVPVLLILRSDMERQLERPDAAITDATRALGLIEDAAQPGTFSMFAGRAYLALGRALQVQGRSAAARGNFGLAAECLEKSLGPQNKEALEARRLAASGNP